MTDELWDALIELIDVRPGECTLIGGQMVFIAHRSRRNRVTIDVLTSDGLGERTD